MTTSTFFPRRLSRAALAAAVAVPLAGAAVLWTTTSVSSAAAQSKAVHTVAIPVHGMMCMSCASSIKQHVKKLPGVSNVEVSLVGSMVRVTYSANQPNLPNRIVSSINALGYRAGKPTVVR